MNTLWTIPELDAQISLWKQALSACASGKAYTIDNRTLTRQDVDTILSTLDVLQARKNELVNGGRRGPYMVRADLHGRR